MAKAVEVLMTIAADNAEEVKAYLNFIALSIL